MGRTARQWMEQDFSAARYRDRLCNLYRELHVPIPANSTSVATTA
jgi:hypothetical protein